MSAVVFCRQGSLVRLTSPDGNPPPPKACSLVEASLTYTHREFVRGADAYDRASGRYARVKTERRNLYTYQRSCPVFQRGFERRVWRLCQEAGLTPTLVDITPPHPRPDRFDFRPEKIVERMQLLARQDELLAAIASNEYGQVWAPTGFGKGYGVLAVALGFPNAKVVAITARRDVADTLESRLVAHMPKVGRVGSNRHDWQRVTVVTADSMHKIVHDVANEPDIVLYDEVHEAPTPSRLLQLSRFLYSRNYGFSASPNCRSDGADFRLEGYFGPPIFEMSFQEAVQLGLILDIRVSMIAVNMSSNPCEDMTDTAKERNGIWRNRVRNQIVADAANALPEDEQRLVMVRSVEHAFYLKKLLPDYSLCYDKVDSDQYQWYARQGLFDPATEPIMTPARRKSLTRQFESGHLRKVISNDVWSTGVSFNQLTTLIRADARAAKGISIQMPGRTCRRDDAGGKQFGRLIDFRDNFDVGLQRKSNDREAVYKGMGWTIKRMTPEEFASEARSPDLSCAG